MTTAQTPPCLPPARDLSPGGLSSVRHSRMAYDEKLADRIRELVHGEEGLTEKRMFGGLAFLIQGNMAVSASGQGGLLLRVDPDHTEALLGNLHAHRAEMRGRVMNGWLRIDTGGLLTDHQLHQWVARGVAYARSLPPKPDQDRPKEQR